MVWKPDHLRFRDSHRHHYKYLHACLQRCRRHHFAIGNHHGGHCTDSRRFAFGHSELHRRRQHQHADVVCQRCNRLHRIGSLVRHSSNFRQLEYFTRSNKQLRSSLHGTGRYCFASCNHHRADCTNRFVSSRPEFNRFRQRQHVELVFCRCVVMHCFGGVVRNQVDFRNCNHYTKRDRHLFPYMHGDRWHRFAICNRHGADCAVGIIVGQSQFHCCGQRQHADLVFIQCHFMQRFGRVVWNARDFGKHRRHTQRDEHLLACLQRNRWYRSASRHRHGADCTDCLVISQPQFHYRG